MSDALNKLLKDWHRPHLRQGGELEPLRRQIQQRLARGEGWWDESLPSRPAWSWWGRLAYAGAGAAAVLLWGAFFHQPRTGSDLASNGTADFAAIAARDMDQTGGVFREMTQLFNHRLQWMVTSGNEVSLSVEAEDEGATRAVWVRVVVVARRLDEEVWRSVWKADVMTHPEQLVHLQPKDRAGNELALWVYPNGDGTYALESSLELETPTRLVAQTTKIMSEGPPQRVLTMRTGDEEVRVYQTLRSLPEVGG